MEYSINNANPYGIQLAENINKLSQNLKAVYNGGNITLRVDEKLGEKQEIRTWLHSLLSTLPEIEYPVERLQFIIYIKGSLALVTIINPSAFDVMALDYAKDNQLGFSKDSTGADYRVPLPLDHPYYTDKDYFKKLPKEAKKKNITFDDIKDLPNVRPIIEQLRKDGIKI